MKLGVSEDGIKQIRYICPAWEIGKMIPSKEAPHGWEDGTLLCLCIHISSADRNVFRGLDRQGSCGSMDTRVTLFTDFFGLYNVGFRGLD